MKKISSSTPPVIKTLNRAGKLLSRIPLSIAPLERDALQETASKHTGGLTDFGNPYYEEGINTLLQSIQKDVNFHFFGRLTLNRFIVTGLENRLLLAEAQKQKPAWMDTPIRPPLIVTGPPRSGTTFLHRLLGEDLESRTPRLWELMRPLRKPNRLLDLRHQTAQFEFNLRMSQGDIDHMHYVRAESPEECMWMLTLSFASFTFWSLAPVYDFLSWKLQTDFETKYQEYRLLLKKLQSTAPGNRLTLKSPEHALALEELFAAIPNAMVIFTHRDPLQLIPSLNSLHAKTQTIVTEDIDLPLTVQKNIELMEVGEERVNKAREKYSRQIYDVRFNDLIQDPVRTIQGVYEYFCLPWDRSLKNKMKAFVERNPRGKHGKHRYQLEDFGLTRKNILERFGTYRKQFGFEERRS